MQIKSTMSLIAFAICFSTAAMAQNPLKATGGTGLYKDKICWFDYSNLAFNRAMSGPTKFRIGSLEVTVDVSNISFSGTSTNGPGNSSTTMIIGYVPGSSPGDGLDEMYNIGGVNASNTLANAITTNFGGNHQNTPNESLIANFKLSVYATLNGQPIDVGLVFANAGDDSNTGAPVPSNSPGFEYSKGTTNGSAWQLIEQSVNTGATAGGNRFIDYSNNDQTMRMSMGRLNQNGTDAEPANVALMYTRKNAASEVSPLVVDAVLSGDGKTAIAIGIVIGHDNGDLYGTYQNSRNIIVPDFTAGGNPNAGVDTRVYLNNGIAAPGPIISPASLSLPSNLKIGALAPDMDRLIVEGTSATLDDLTGLDDEDGLNGIVIPGMYLGKTVFSIPNIPVTNTLDVSANLIGWVDFDQNGRFESNEGTSVVVASGATSATLTWSGLTGVKNGPTSIRLKISADPAMSTSTSYGEHLGGETEDYKINNVTVGGAVFNDKNANGLTEPGEAFVTRYMYVNAIKDGVVLSSAGTELSQGFGAGRYYIAGLPSNTSGLSLRISQNWVAAGSSATLLNTAAPAGYMFTHDNIGGVPESVTGGTALSSANNISNIVTGNSQMNSYNFGILQFPVASTINYNLPSQPSAGQTLTFTGAGDLPVVGNGTTVSSLVITQLPTNGVELYYNSGAGLRSLQVNGALTGAELILPNQEIPEFDANKLTIKLVGTGYNTTTFYYAFSDVLGNLGAQAPYTITWADALPVKLTRFAVAKEGLNAVLRWNTSSEDNSDRFDVEHSLDGKRWSIIGTIPAQNISSESVDYQFIHQSILDHENIYRLKMIDLDGTFSYSHMKSIQPELPLSIITYPNPGSQTIHINTSQLSDVKIYDLMGILVLSPDVNPEINVNTLLEGTYILQITRKDGAVSSTKFLIKR
jgi:hypothetical protein